MVLYYWIPHRSRWNNHWCHGSEHQHVDWSGGPYRHGSSVRRTILPTLNVWLTLALLLLQLSDILLLGDRRAGSSQMALFSELLCLRRVDPDQSSGGKDRLHLPADAAEMARELHLHGRCQRVECALLVSMGFYLSASEIGCADVCSQVFILPSANLPHVAS